jgi:hypothetical protein
MVFLWWMPKRTRLEMKIKGEKRLEKVIREAVSKVRT